MVADSSIHLAPVCRSMGPRDFCRNENISSFDSCAPSSSLILCRESRVGRKMVSITALHANDLDSVLRRMSNYKEFCTDHMSKADICFAHRRNICCISGVRFWLWELNPAVLLKCMFWKEEGSYTILALRDITSQVYTNASQPSQETRSSRLDFGLWLKSLKWLWKSESILLFWSLWWAEERGPCGHLCIPHATAEKWSPRVSVWLMSETLHVQPLVSWFWT